MMDPSLENELRCLPGLSREELCERWESLIGATPPRGFAPRILLHVVAHELQAQHKGGLKPAVREQLSQITNSTERKSSRNVLPLRLGNRLVREWRGKTYVVDVVEKGFEYRGRRYGSLSRVARQITGAHWSGPRFFGLATRSAS